MRTLISAFHFLAYQIVQQVLSWITLFIQGTGESQREYACASMCYVITHKKRKETNLYQHPSSTKTQKTVQIHIQLVPAFDFSHQMPYKKWITHIRPNFQFPCNPS